MVLPPPIGLQLWDPFRIIKINGEDLRELLDSKGPNGNNEALQ
jgi:hypothetical protein